jgi:plasmid maintenance system antidote protein VapI
MNTKIPAIAFHPGTHVLDEMHARNWTCKTLANKSGLPIEELKELIVGEIV